MSIELVDMNTGETVERYSAFRLSLIGLTHRVIDGRAPTSGLSRSEFKSKAMSLAVSFINSEYSYVHANTTKAVLRAVSDATSSIDVVISSSDKKMLIDSIDEVVEDVMSSLESQLERDVRSSVKQLRDMAIRVDLLKSQKGWSQVASLIAVRERERKDINFEYRDAAGRRWKSDRYVKTVARSHYLNSYNDAYVYTLAKAGVNCANLVSKDNKVDVPFRIVDDGSSSHLVIYEDLISAGVIHPNSSYLVENC